MTRSKRFRILMMAAVSLAIVAAPLLGVVLSRTNLEGVASPPSRAQAAFERGSDAWLIAQSHVSHPHPQHRGPKQHCMPLQKEVLLDRSHSRQAVRYAKGKEQRKEIER